MLDEEKNNGNGVVEEEEVSDFTEEELEELKNDPKIQKLLEKETNPLLEEKQKLYKSRNKILSEKKNVQKQRDELYSKLDNEEENNDETEINNVSDKQKVENLQKRIQKFEKQLRDKDEENKNLSMKQKNYMIDTELTNKLVSAGVTDKNLLKYAKNGIKNEYNLDLLEDDEGPQFTVENEDLDTFIQRWIQDEGSNFVSKKTTSGGGSRGSQNTSNPNKLTRKNMSYEQKAEFLKKHTPQEYADIPFE